MGLSSLMDTWLLLKAIEEKGERNRGINILKSRGMPHSNQMREFILSDQGLQILDVYTGPDGVLTGASRSAQEARDKAEALGCRQEIERKHREMNRREQLVETQIAALRKEFESEREELLRIIGQEKSREEALFSESGEIARIREADKLDETTARRNSERKDQE